MSINISSEDNNSTDTDMPEIVVNNFGKDSQCNDDVFDLIVGTDCKVARAVATLSSAGSSSGISSGYGSGSQIVGSPKASKKQTAKSKKQTLAEEREAKRAASEQQKIYKPGECMKYMRIEVSNELLTQWYCADVEREATAAGARVVCGCSELALVHWSRAQPRTLAAAAHQLELTPSTERCDHALYVRSMDDIVPYVSDRTLSAHVATMKAKAGCQLTLVVFGHKKYFKTSKRKTAENRPLISEIDFEMALTDVLVSADCDTCVVDTPNELALLIVQFTKAIAEAPYKKAQRACDEKAEFYMRGDNKKCVVIDKDGVGLSRLWQQMVAVLPLSSLETSRAVCAKYKSPLALYEAVQSPDSIKELSDIGVARAAVPGSRARRLGPEFARKLRTLFTAEDGDVLLE